MTEDHPGLICRSVKGQGNLKVAGSSPARPFERFANVPWLLKSLRETRHVKNLRDRREAQGSAVAWNAAPAVKGTENTMIADGGEDLAKDRFGTYAWRATNSRSQYPFVSCWCEGVRGKGNLVFRGCVRPNLTSVVKCCFVCAC